MTAPSTAQPTVAPTVLVVGMHRSGTSMLTQLIARLGAYAGRQEELLPPDQCNPHGYWERLDVVGAHETLLRENGRDWENLAGFDVARCTPASVDRARARLAQALASIDSRGAPRVIKDPRLCLVLPLWQALLPDARCILVVRDPHTIAASLRRAFPGLFTTHFVLALWQKYMQLALTALHGRQVLFVDYGRFLADTPLQCRRLLDGLASLGVDGLRPLGSAHLEALADRKLDRSSQDRDGAAGGLLSREQENLHAWLMAACNAAGPRRVADLPALHAPDAVLLEFTQLREQCVRRGQAYAQRNLRQA